MVSFTAESLPELMPIYYKRLFPYGPFYRWLSYGNVSPNVFCNREMSFTLPGEIYLRYLSFDNLEDLEEEMQKKCPEKIDIGGIYNVKPSLRRTVTSFDVEERELVFDIDMSDYNDVRSCCTDANVCIKCWKLMTIATKILDAAFREDFGFKHILWVFSGRRGVHCWVCDETARKLEPKVRSDLAEYLQLLSRQDSNGKLAHISAERFHPSIKRAVDIISEDFVSMTVEEQDILGSVKGMTTILALCGDDNLKKDVESAWETVPPTSKARWEALTSVHATLLTKGKLKYKTRHIIEEIMLQYAYPRLDIEVTKSRNHLLKAPFCIHPKTGKVCVPFNPNAVSKFNPETVPTISELVQEIQEYDAKKAADEVKTKVKDYKKTSMYRGVQVFEEFLRALEDTWKTKKTKTEGIQNWNKN